LVLSCGFSALSKIDSPQKKQNSDSLFSHDANHTKTLPLLKSIKVNGTQLYTDAIENYYVASQNSICKTSSQNNSKFIYSLKRSGTITSIDAGDPMRVLVFYKDLSLITFLDNFMAEASSISLMDFGLDQAETVCKALNNGIWVYDIKQDKLVKISAALNIDVEILNIQRIIGENFNPTQMIERNNGLYLNDPAKGIFVFDNYGAYLRKIPEPNIRKFNVLDDILSFRRNNDIFSLNTETLELSKIYSDSTMTDFSITEKKLFILNADSLHIYKLNP
jgi:hypothetical protein